MTLGEITVSEHTYMLALDANSALGDLEKIQHFVTDSPEFVSWWNHLPMVFMLETSAPAASISQKLHALAPDVRFMLTKVDLSVSEGWLPDTSWKWIEKRAAATMLLVTALTHRVDEPNIEAGFQRFAALTGSSVDYAAFADAVATCVRQGLIHEPIRLPEGALQCHWRLELTSAGVEAARKARALSFETLGFTSPDMNEFVAAVTTQEPTKAWFAFAHDLNRFAFEIIRDHPTPPPSDTQRFTLAALFLRAHQSAQAAAILAERGMIGDARTVLRTAVEGVIAMFALAASAEFIEQLTDDTVLNRAKLAGIVLDESIFTASYGKLEVAQMKATVAEAKALLDQRGKKSGWRPIIWEQIAAKQCPKLYTLLYRPLSSDGTHTNLDAVNRHVTTDGQGNVIGLKGGPDASGIAEVLKYATLMLLWAIDPISRAFPSDGLDDRIQGYTRRFQELSGSEG